MSVARDASASAFPGYEGPGADLRGKRSDLRQNVASCRPAARPGVQGKGQGKGEGKGQAMV